MSGGGHMAPPATPHMDPHFQLSEWWARSFSQRTRLVFVSMFPPTVCCWRVGRWLNLHTCTPRAFIPSNHSRGLSPISSQTPLQVTEGIAARGADPSSSSRSGRWGGTLPLDRLCSSQRRQGELAEPGSARRSCCCSSGCGGGVVVCDVCAVW